MSRTIVALDVATGSYTNIADDVSVRGINVEISGTLSVTGSAYLSNTEISGYPLSSTRISGSLTKLADGSSYLVAGSNINIVSNSNGSVTISSTASGGSSAVSYNGYCTGSLQWNSTTWADFHTVPGNFTDTLQVGIIRSGSTFTVDSSGTYLFRSDFNHQNYYGYTAFRLSGSNGTIIQQTVFGAAYIPNDGDGADLTGIFTLAANESFKLQYVWKNVAGASNAWPTSDPIDGENMRTGVIDIFRIGTS